MSSDHRLEIWQYCLRRMERIDGWKDLVFVADQPNATPDDIIEKDLTSHSSIISVAEDEDGDAVMEDVEVSEGEDEPQPVALRRSSRSSRGSGTSNTILNSSSTTKSKTSRASTTPSRKKRGSKRGRGNKNKTVVCDFPGCQDHSSDNTVLCDNATFNSNCNVQMFHSTCSTNFYETVMGRDSNSYVDTCHACAAGLNFSWD